jgi:hypothetical protein
MSPGRLLGDPYFEKRLQEENPRAKTLSVGPYLGGKSTGAHFLAHRQLQLPRLCIRAIMNSPSATLTIIEPAAMGVALPVQLSVPTWRSADGSRLSGNATVNLTCGPSPCLNNYISPFELVAGQ